MTVQELIEELKKYPADAEIRRIITREYGLTDVETVEYKSEANIVIID